VHVQFSPAPSCTEVALYELVQEYLS